MTRNALRTIFVRSTAVFLVLTAFAKLYSVTGSVRILTATDPLLHLANRELMIGAGLLELGIAVYLLVGRTVAAQMHLIFWLSANFVLYRFGIHWIGYHACPCLGTLGAKLPFSQDTINQILHGMVWYWFLGSVAFLWPVWNLDSSPVADRPVSQPSS
jgi:hypothetical protein